jgi:dihydropteroate synthase
LLKSFIRHIINNFVADFNKETMNFWSDKITPFSGNTSLTCGKNVLTLDKPLVMGILNLTPDSFYDGGRYLGKKAWLSQASVMIEEGASIIDIGAVSTRPGAVEVSEEEELSRLIIVIETLTAKYPETVFSVDTYRSKVARLAAEAGAGIINDISGGIFDPDLIPTVASTGLPYILMHMQGAPTDMQTNPFYSNVTDEINFFFNQRLEKLKEAGIKKIILDPGFGFGKSTRHNYQLLNRLKDFKQHCLPLLVGLSRKSMIYKLLDVSPEEALSGTSAIHMLALINGADILRVHDVKEAIQVIKLADAYTKASE